MRSRILNSMQHFGPTGGDVFRAKYSDFRLISWLCIWELYKENKQKPGQRKSLKCLFVKSFNNIKKRSKGKSTGGRCCSGCGRSWWWGGGGGGGLGVAATQTVLLHIWHYLNNPLWHEGRLLSYMVVHSLSSTIIQVTQYNWTLVVQSAVNTNPKSCCWKKIKTWKANWEHDQNLFNFPVNKLLCITIGNSGWHHWHLTLKDNVPMLEISNPGERISGSNLNKATI